MKITILNGEPDAGSHFDAYVGRVAALAAATGDNVRVLHLRELDLKGCSGCWGCWVKTPGQCAKRDDSEAVCRAVLQSDLLVLASPIVMGFTTALLKRAADQMIPLVHPYLVMEGGEMHHRPRYSRYPLMALLLGPGLDCDSEDLEITTAIWARTARNMKSRLVHVAVAERAPEEVADELVAAA
jgi:NADPH-dependent FMN reductase